MSISLNNTDIHVSVDMLYGSRDGNKPNKKLMQVQTEHTGDDEKLLFKFQ